MRKTPIPILIGVLCASFSVSTTTPVAPHSIKPLKDVRSITSTHSNSLQDIIYKQSGLEEAGLTRDAFDYAWKGYQKLRSEGKLTNCALLTICDFSQCSSAKRFYIVDTETRELVINTFVAHGKNSGDEYATRFSNTPESLQSSLGFFITDKTYIGAHGLSLRLNGVDKGFNDNAYSRAIVLHGASYVDASRAQYGVRMGRSFGCPAVPQKESASIINTIKNGSCLFIYHPGEKYLHTSKILNG